MEVILDSGASFQPKSNMWEDSVGDVLISGPEERSGLRSVFGLLDSGMLVSVLGISVVSVAPLVLPTQVVWVAIVVADFIILDRVEQASDWAS